MTVTVTTFTFASGSVPVHVGSLISAYAEQTSQLNTEHRAKVTLKETRAIFLTFSMSRALIMEELCRGGGERGTSLSLLLNGSHHLFQVRGREVKVCPAGGKGCL